MNFFRRRRARLMARAVLAESKLSYLHDLFAEADAAYLDQQLHWWAWREALRVLEIELVPRTEHGKLRSAGPGPGEGSGVQPLSSLDTHDPAHDPGPADGRGVRVAGRSL